MPDRDQLVVAGRRAYDAADWASAHDLLSRARAEDDGLGVDDLVMLARSGWLVGRVPESLSAAEAAFRGLCDAGRMDEAAMNALQLSMLWYTRGDMAVGAAWLNRARRLLADLPDGPPHAYLAYIEAAAEAMEGIESAQPHIARLADLARRFPTPSVQALNLVVAGLDSLRAGDTARGFAQLDEAMLPVLANELPAEWAGDIYCTVMHVCHQLAEYRRMDEWTRATENWCRTLGSDAIYAGICRVHRLELRSARGDWDDVETHLSRVSMDLAGGNPWIAGEGFYQLGELRRLRGAAAAAREAFAQARESGIDPQPGEALLALQTGDGAAAWMAIRAALASRGPMARVRLLRAGVEIALSQGQVAGARDLAAELRAAADEYRSPGFRAWADHAEGMLALADGDARRALAALRQAEDAFRRQRQAFEHARVLALLARAHEVLGDRIAAAGAQSAADEIVQRLGAHPDAVRTAVPVAASTGPLTAREAEVLALVAEGASNRQVADALFLSEKTVGRHLANIYAKIGVGSRTAAASWWRENSR